MSTVVHKQDTPEPEPVQRLHRWLYDASATEYVCRHCNVATKLVDGRNPGFCAPTNPVQLTLFRTRAQPVMLTFNAATARENPEEPGRLVFDDGLWAKVWTGDDLPPNRYDEQVAEFLLYQAERWTSSESLQVAIRAVRASMATATEPVDLETT